MMMDELRVQSQVNQGFDDAINLWNFIGQNDSVKYLRCVTNQYYNDKLEGRGLHLPSLLIISAQTGFGAETLARAYSNTLCRRFVYVSGQVLGRDLNTRDFFQNVDAGSTIFISDAQFLRPLAQQIVVHILQTKLLVRRLPSQIIESSDYADRQIILSANSEHNRRIQLISATEWLKFW